jgi:hypothetical protein
MKGSTVTRADHPYEPDRAGENKRGGENSDTPDTPSNGNTPVPYDSGKVDRRYSKSVAPAAKRILDVLLVRSPTNRPSRVVVVPMAAAIYTFLTVITLVIIIVILAVAFLRQPANPRPEESVTPVAQTPTTSPTNSQTAVLPSPSFSTTPTESASQSSGLTAEPQVRYKGKLAVTPAGKDLDLNPPARPDSGDSEDRGDLSYNFIDAGLEPESDASLADWDNKALPSYADCANLASAASVSRMEDLKEGQIICARTDEGRIARLKLTGWGDGYTYFFDAVIWELSTPAP